MNTRGRIRIGLIVGTGAALVMIAATFAGVRYTSQSSFCASCHEMQGLHRDWTKGSHAKAQCYDCHVDNTLSGHVMAKVNGLRQVYTHSPRRWIWRK